MRIWMLGVLLVVWGCGAAPRGEATLSKPPRYQLSQRPAGPGALYLIGGGDNEPALLRRFVATAGGPDAPIVVAPWANGAPEGDRLRAAFEAVGARRVSVLAGGPDDERLIREAYGLYLTGGLPEKLLAASPPYREAVAAAWRAGCVVGGTSAGAMVWGSRAIVSGESDQALRHGIDEAAGGLALREGFGLLAGAIVDPHFNERARFHRLWVAAGETRSLGLGIDPRTAALVGADGRLTALGAGTVTLIRPEGSGAARVAVLQAGRSLDLAGWRE